MAPRKIDGNEVAGRVLGPGGVAVADALVSLATGFDPARAEPALEARSNADGRFRVSGLPPGEYGVTATHAGLAAGYGGMVHVRRGTPSEAVNLQLGGPGVRLRGTVRDEAGATVPGARLLAAAFSEHRGEVYVTLSDADGRYLLHLPEQAQFMLVADAAPRPRQYRVVRADAPTADFELGPAPAPRPDAAAITTWLREQATPLSLSRTSDLDPAGVRAFVELVGDAPVVALGEATHGSADFPEWRQRVFEALVRELGFSVIALEAPWAESQVVNDYVLRGRGNARAAVRGMHGTEETLALVEWMRAYNADPAHATELHFAGYDPHAPLAVTELVTYLRKVDAGAAATAERALAPLSRWDAESTFPTLPEPQRQRARAAADAVTERLEAKRADYATRTSEAEWELARRLSRVIAQAAACYEDYSARDEHLFDGVRWLVAQHPPGTRIVLGGHNGHIAAERHNLLYLGQLLREHWGSEYLAIGLAFGEGELNALDWVDGPSNVHRTFRLERAPLDSFDGALSLAGQAAFLIDLRRAEGSIATWLRSPQRLHHVGGRFLGPDASFETYTPARAFDAVLYLDRVSANRPLSHAP